MAHAWKACWVQALGGSNPPSSAIRPGIPVIPGLFVDIAMILVSDRGQVGGLDVPCAVMQPWFMTAAMLPVSACWSSCTEEGIPWFNEHRDPRDADPRESRAGRGTKTKPQRPDR